MHCQSTLIRENKVERSSSAWPAAQTTPEQAGHTGRLQLNSTRTYAAAHGCFALLFLGGRREGGCFLCLCCNAKRDRTSLNAQGQQKGLLTSKIVHPSCHCPQKFLCIWCFYDGTLLAVVEWLSFYFCYNI